MVYGPDLLVRLVLEIKRAINSPATPRSLQQLQRQEPGSLAAETAMLRLSPIVCRSLRWKYLSQGLAVLGFRLIGGTEGAWQILGHMRVARNSGLLEVENHFNGFYGYGLKDPASLQRTIRRIEVYQPGLKNKLCFMERLFFGTHHNCPNTSRWSSVAR